MTVFTFSDKFSPVFRMEHIIFGETVRFFRDAGKGNLFRRRGISPPEGIS